MASIMICRRLSYKFLKSSYFSYISSVSAAENSKFESFAHDFSIFAHQAKPVNHNFHFSISTSTPPNHISFFESQGLTQPKPTTSNNIFLQPYSSFATKSKNHNFIRSTAEKPRLFPSTTFYREKSRVSDLKLKEITLTNALLKNQNPRNFSTSDSSSDTEIPQNPTEDPSKNLNFKHKEIEGTTVERQISALANENRKELEKIKKNVYGFIKLVASIVIVLLGLGNWIYYILEGSLTEVSIQLFNGNPIQASMQNIWVVANVLGFGFLSALGIHSKNWIYSFKKVEKQFKMIEEHGSLEILIGLWRSVKEFNLRVVRARSVFIVMGQQNEHHLRKSKS
ncbi:uncharacterized protein LOC110008895 [Jatropha curcas]|uniref:uncharacterized protein LOC110008895 n=1 Tax=Jatropha curcas TaxID=180498 RepID=UPI0009D79833|nr:uncharacterized protein LOC110008895 [Jatropha curcas]